MNKETNGPAFPQAIPDENGGSTTYWHGLTARDYFAAKAMQGFIGHVDYRTFPADLLARDAYEVADAMLKAREQ